MAKVQRLPALQRYKNIGKSFGYAAVDVAGQLNPTLARLGRETKMVVSDVSSSIRDIDKDSITQSIKDFTNPNGDNAINNIINDFKTGQWYNKDRIEGGGMFDDMDFNFDDEDWGDASSETYGGDEDESTSKTLIGGMQNLSTDLAMSMGRTSAASAEYIAKSGHRDAMATYDLTKTGFTNVTNILMNMNHKMDVLIEMQAPVVQQAQNTFIFQTKATEFFENTNETLNKMNASLERIVENTNILNPAYQPKRNNRRDKSLSSLIVGDEFDFGAYFDMIKENVKETKDMVKSLTDMGAMAAGKNGKNLSPVAMAMTGVMKAMVPDIMKDSMKAMNQSFEGFVPMLLKDLKQSTTKKGGLLGILGDLFLPDISVKNKYSKNNYNKGPVAWDGIARKSVVEVIPTYLAKIYAALGGEEKYYDFSQGKFVSGASIVRDFKGKSAYDAKQAGGALRTQALSNARGDRRSQMEIEEFFIKAVNGEADLKDVRRRGRSNKEYNDFLKSVGLSPKAARALIQSTKDMDTAELARYTMAMLSAQQNTSKRYKQEEERGYSNLDYIDNGFTVSKDRFKMSQSEYLHGIYQMVGNIYGIMSGGSGKNVFDMKSGRFMSLAEKQNKERSNMDRKYRRNKTYDPNHPEFTDEELDQYEFFGMTDKEIEDYKQKKKWEDKAKEARGQAKSRVGKAFHNVRNWGRRKLGKAELSEDEDASPFKRITDRVVGIFDTVSDGLMDLLYGERGDKGIIETIKDRFQEFMKEKIIDPFKDFFKENIWNPIKGYAGEVWGGIKEGFGNKQRAKGTKARLQEKYTPEQLAAFRARKAGTTNVPIEGAATGRRVTRTGLIAVSEGELIIPSEYNPFYKGRTNKARQIRDEEAVISKFYGGFASGGSIGQTIGGNVNDAATAVGYGVSKFMQAVMGDTSEKGIEDQKKKISQGISKIMEDMGVNKKAMGVGAIAGVGVSILTGAVVGPIAGAAIGAGVGLISKSEFLQKMIFGEIKTDKDGNVIEDKRTFIGKAKDTLVSGVQNALKKVGSKITPEMIGGAGIGALIGGPFGIIGGALMGGATGFLSTTEKFKIFMFGDGSKSKEDDDSFTGLLRNKVFANLDDIFHNTGIAIRGLFRDLNKKITSSVKNIMEDIRKKAMASRAGRAISGLGKVAGGIVKAPVRMVGGVLGGINRGLQRQNLRKGLNIWNRAEKRNMTAEERIAAREQLGTDIEGLDRKNLNLDQMINSRTSEELFELQDEIRMLQDSKWAKKKSQNDTMENMYKDLSSKGVELTPNVKNKIDRLVRGGNYGEAVRTLRSAGINNTDAEKIVGNAVAATKNTNQVGKAIEAARTNLKNKGIDLSTDAKGEKALQLIEDEIKAKGYTRESAEQKQEEKDKNDYAGTLFGMMASLVRNVSALNGEVVDPIPLMKGKFKAIVAFNPAQNTLTGAQRELQQKLDDKKAELMERYKDDPRYKAKYGSSEEGDVDKNEIITKTDGFGGIHRYRKNPQTGELEEVTNDKETDMSKKKLDKFFESINNLPLIGTAMQKVSGLFGSLHDKLFGSKDNPDKKGIFGTLFDFFTGAKTTVLSKLTEFFTGTKIGTALKTIGGNLTLGNVLTAFIGPALMAGAFTGLFDEWFNKLFGRLALLKGNDTKDAFSDEKVQSKTVVDPETGETVPLDIHAGFDNSLSGNLKRNMLSTTIRGLARGGKGLGGVAAAVFRRGKKALTNDILRGTAIGGNMAKYGIIKGGFIDIAQKAAVRRGAKATKLAAKSASYLDDAVRAANSGAKKSASKLAAKASKTATKAAEMSGKSASAIKTATAFAEKGMIEGISTALANACERLPDILKKIPFLPASLKNNADDLALQLFTHLDDALKGAGKKLATIATKIADIMPLINIAYSVAVGINAWGNAESILGITDTATFGQKCIATLIAVVNSLIPFVGDLIPNNVLVNIFMTILPKIGIDVSDLQQQREEANKTVSEFNAQLAEHDITLANGTVLKQGTELSIAQYNELVQGKAGIFTKGWHAVQNGWSKFKAQGGIKGAAKKAWNGAKALGKSIKENGIAGTAENMLNKIDEYEPTSKIGKVLKTGWDAFGSKLAQMKLLAIKGDVKGLFNYKMENKTESGIEKFLNIGLNVYRFTNMPLAIASFIGHHIVEFFAKTVNKIKSEYNQYSQITKGLYDKMKTGDIKALWDVDTESFASEDNPVGGFQKFMAFSNKIYYSLPTLIIGAGKKISEFFTNTVNKVKSTINTVHTEFAKGWEMIHDTDSSLDQMLDVSDVDNDPENPIGGFTKGLIIGSRIAAIPMAIAHKIGKAISDKVHGVVETIKSEYNQYAEITETLRDKMKTGDIKELWAVNVEDMSSDDNPVGGFQKFLAFSNKVYYSIPTMIIGAGKKVAEWAANLFNKVKSEAEQYMTITDSIRDKVSTGSIKELWAVDVEAAGSDDNPVGGFQKFLAFSNKVYYSIPTMIVGLGKAIAEGFNKMKDANKSNRTNYETAIEKLNEMAKNSDTKLSDIWNESVDFDKADPLHKIWDAGLTISKLFNSIVAIIHKLAGPLKDAVDAVKEKIEPIVEGVNDVKEWVGDKKDQAGNWLSDRANDVANFGHGIASGAYDMAKNFVSGGSSFINQRSSGYANRRFAGSTFGEKGCGPAVASMAASSLGRNMSLGSAVNRSRGYQNSNGVDIGYFGDALGQSGISTQYVSGAGAASQLAAGNKVILLGQDGRNTSKSRSPFGPGNHYVLATGIKNGKVMVNDPENSGPRAYSPSILNNVKMV